MVKNIILISLIVLTGFSAFADAPSRISREQYIEMWKDVAIRNMVEYKIPASITLAQGILESGYGNSDLAREANNHFGIKCHDWKGAKFFKDDDKKDECFRSYKDASESYRDHSLFLTSRSRYASLFELKQTDYKGWAKGLKKAGYATNPKYADLLIDLIEKNDLQKFDKEGYGVEWIEEVEVKPSQEIVLKPTKTETTVKESTVVVKTAKTHQVFKRNKIKYVVAGKGDTFYRIAREFEMTLSQLYNYNDFDKHKDVLEEGDIVYLQPKKGKSMAKEQRRISDGTMNYIEISQQEGIKLTKLMKKNNVTNPEVTPEKGKMIFLR